MVNINRIVVPFITLIFLLSSCKKDKDIVSTQSIHGQVYNQCTDSGMANIIVYLKENENNIAQLNSDANGNFSFTNVQIHSSSDYAYSLYITSKSGIGNGPEVGIDAGEWDVDKSNFNTSYTLGVVPHSKVFYLCFPSSINSAIYNDTFTLTVQQNTYHKHFPNGNWKSIQVIAPCPPPINSFGGLANYWMGWWQITLDKTVNGTHIIQKDSFYVGYGATVTDTIPW